MVPCMRSLRSFPRPWNLHPMHPDWVKFADHSLCVSFTVIDIMTTNTTTTTTMSSKTSPTKEKSSPYRLFDIVILLSSAWGNGPLSFSTVALASFGSSYLIRLLNDFPHPLLSGIALVTTYYFLLGFYQLIIYHHYLDPTLSIPGPKVIPTAKLIHVTGTLAQRRKPNHTRLRSTPKFHKTNKRQRYPNENG
jgi:hypothetical protein